MFGRSENGRSGGCRPAGKRMLSPVYEVWAARGHLQHGSLPYTQAFSEQTLDTYRRLY